MMSRRAPSGVRVGKPAKFPKNNGIEENTVAPTPPQSATGGGNYQQQNSSTTPPSQTSTQAQPSTPINSQKMGQAAKLADKMKTDPNVQQNKQALGNRVKSLIGTVGGSSSDSDMMTDLVAAQLIQSGDIDPNKMK
jgi:hypothetical protein